MNKRKSLELCHGKLCLYDLAISKEIVEAEVNGKDKDTIITRLLSTSLVSDEEINRLVETTFTEIESLSRFGPLIRIFLPMITILLPS